jgi:membrane associated rhomboid family serine protease
MAVTPAEHSYAPRLTRAVQWLIAINVAVYFLQVTVIGAQNMLPALGFQSQDLARSWWTIGTYMFVHAGFWSLALNLYMLYVFGPRLEQSWSASEFTKFYVAAGLGGWLFHLVFAREALLIGSSAAVLGVTLAYALHWPDDEVYLFGLLPLRVKWMVALLAGLNLIVGMAGGGAGGGIAYLSHLGGLAAGWLYLRSASTGARIDRIKQRVSPAPDLPDETPRAVPRSMPRAREKGSDIDEIVARSNAAVSRRPAPDLTPQNKARQTPSDLDIVLDKISQHGIDSLTSVERRLLEEWSRELRRGDG